MKLYYQLPYLTYDFSNSNFIEFEFEDALQLYKLLYKDIETFQKEFLNKLELIPNLEPLCLQLGINFENAIPIRLEKLQKSEDEIVQCLANYFSEITEDTKTDRSFYNNSIKKLKEFLNEDNSEQYWHQPPASLSDLVHNKHPKTISKIEYYTIPIEDEYVEITIRDIKSLESNRNTKYLVCNDCNIESIRLNEQLILIEAHSNKINSIELTHYLEEAVLWDNPLEYVKLNANLKLLHLSHPKNHNIIIDNSINNEKVEIYYTIN